MFRCKRCGYTSVYKSNLKTHLRRKKPCPPLHSDMTPKSLLLELMPAPATAPKPTLNPKSQSESKSKSKPVTAPTPSLIPKHAVKIVQYAPVVLSSSVKSHTCKYCSKTYSKNSNLHRHLKKCPHKKKAEDWEEQLLQYKKERQELREQVSTLLHTLANTNNGQKQSDNVGGTTTHQTNCHNTNNIQININNYGHENLDYVTQDFVQNLFSIPYGALPKLIKFIHFHPQHPENHNVKIPNKKQNLALIHNNGKWEYRNKKM